LQRPTATRVAGFGAWKELGRFVKRGEKGTDAIALKVKQKFTARAKLPQKVKTKPAVKANKAA